MRPLAHIISFAFHPLLIVSYLVGFMLVANRQSFGVPELQKATPFLIVVLVYTCIAPLLIVLMMKQLGFVKSLKLQDNKQRIGPLLAVIIMYSSVAYIFYARVNAGYYGVEIPASLAMLMIGATLGLYLAFFVNIFSKVSMHTVGMGVFLGAIAIGYYYNETQHISILGYYVSTLVIFMASIIIAGMVGTARFILHNPSNSDLYGGYVLGLSGMATSFFLSPFLLPMLY